MSFDPSKSRAVPLHTQAGSELSELPEVPRVPSLLLAVESPAVWPLPSLNAQCPMRPALRASVSSAPISQAPERESRSMSSANGQLASPDRSAPASICVRRAQDVEVARRSRRVHEHLRRGLGGLNVVGVSRERRVLTQVVIRARVHAAVITAGVTEGNIVLADRDSASVSSRMPFPLLYIVLL